MVAEVLTLAAPPKAGEPRAALISTGNHQRSYTTLQGITASSSKL